MDADYPTIDRPATPEYVLAVLRDMHRQQCEYDPEADRDADLTFETTVADWRGACDLIRWPELGWAENEIWGIACSGQEWLAVLEPADQRTLRGVCELIARHARRPVVRPARFFGGTCYPAGVFLTIRSMLRQAGADAAAITPSTPLAEHARRYANLFLGPISRLAPGAMPRVRIRTPVYDAGMYGTLLGLLGLATGWCSGLSALVAAGLVIGFVGYGLTWLAARWLLPASVEFAGLRTFRDLAVALAAAGPEPEATN
jgi:hypothetical protein